MNKNLKVSKSIRIDASPENIWFVITDPKKIKVYLFGTECITDWKESSPIIFQGEYEGNKYQDKGNVIEVIQNQKLKYNYWSGFSGLEDKVENYSVITLSIEEKEGLYLFTWLQEGFSSEEGLEHTENGLETMLEQIKALAEN